MYDSKTSIEYFEKRFPHLAEEIHDDTWDGLLHLQIAVFSHWAQDVIDSEDRRAWDDATDAFMVLWKDCTPDVTNAFNVSFLEHLNFANGKRMRSWAYEAMPKLMRKTWKEMDEYNRKIHGS